MYFRSVKAILLGFVFSVAGNAHAASYTNANIYGDLFRNRASGINDVGQIVGEQVMWLGSDSSGSIFRWESPSSQAGVLLTGARYERWVDGAAINNAGSVVGSSNDSAFTSAHAYVVAGGVKTVLSPEVQSSAHGINNAGIVVGQANNQATAWTGTTATTLSNGPYASRANAISDSGLIVGQSFRHATLWNGGTQTDLGALSSASDLSTALAINSGGVVVGESVFAGEGYLAQTHAVAWHGTSITDLGTLGGLNSSASAINDAGLVVGYAQTADGFTHATLWDGAAVIDLNGFITVPGVFGQAQYLESRATGINELGQIVGTATATYFPNYDPSLKSTREFIFTLTPSVPESSTWAMMALGLAGLASVARRRSSGG